MKRLMLFASMAVVLLFVTPGARAQINSVQGSVNLSATSPAESLTLSVPLQTVTFSNLAPNAITAGAPAVTFSLTWTFSTARTMDMYGYFSSSTSALSNGAIIPPTPSAILSSQVEGQVTGTGAVPIAFTAFNQNGAFGGAGASLKLAEVVGTTSSGGTNNYTLNLRINFTGVLSISASTTWTGTLFLQARAI